MAVDTPQILEPVTTRGSYPIVDGIVQSHNYTSPAAPVYVTNGASGNRETNDRSPGGATWPPINRTVLTSFGMMEITPSSIKWQQIVSLDGSVQDEFTITKS